MIFINNDYGHSHICTMSRGRYFFKLKLLADLFQ